MPTRKIIYMLVVGCVLLVGIPAVQAQSLYRISANHPRLRGTVVSVAMGLDSYGFKLKSGGRLYEFQQGPSVDGKPIEYRHGPSRTASITDVGSMVEVTYQGQFDLLDYRLVYRPAHLWITIAGSKSLSATKPRDFWDFKLRWEQASGVWNRATGGCWADTLNSGDYRALRPGYWIVAAGGFTTLAQAEACRKQAVALGKRDAYIRQLW